MNREILFKGFHPDENGKDKVFINGEWIKGKWIYGFVSGLLSYFTDNKSGEITKIDSYYMNCYYDVLASIVGPYTGKDDKNGTKIFGNDYCLVTKSGVMAWGVIKYIDACYFFVENKVQTDGMRNMIRLCDLESNGYEIQVKGNIHANPELLEA